MKKIFNLADDKDLIKVCKIIGLRVGYVGFQECKDHN